VFLSSLGPVRRSSWGAAGAWWAPCFLAGELVGADGYLVELFGESLLFGSGGVEVGSRSFGADGGECGPCCFERGDPGVCLPSAQSKSKQLSGAPAA
jgi:hypothetical protein